MKKYLLLFCLTIFLQNLVNAQWTFTTNYNLPMQIYCFTSDGINIYSGSDYGVYVSTDNGITWNPTNLNKQIRALTYNGSSIFAGTEINGIYMSSNGGGTWSAVNNGLQDTMISALVSVGSTIYAGTGFLGMIGNGVYVSSNNGSSWTPLNNGISNIGISSITVTDTNIFAASRYSIYRSTNNGSSWDPLTNGLPDSMFFSLESEDNNIFLGTRQGVYLSTDNGNNWSLINGNMPVSAVKSFAIDSLNIFVGTESNGVFYSNNNGTNWTSLGLAHNWMTEYLCINDSIILAGDSLGIWRRPIAPIISGIEYLQNTGSIDIFPNPASDKIIIESAAILRDAKIFVYDIQGKLLSQRQLLQTRTDIDISQFAKGLYIIKFSNADKIEMIKFLKE